MHNYPHAKEKFYNAIKIIASNPAPMPDKLSQVMAEICSLSKNHFPPELYMDFENLRELLPEAFKNSQDPEIQERTAILIWKIFRELDDH